MWIYICIHIHIYIYTYVSNLLLDICLWSLFHKYQKRPTTYTKKDQQDNCQKRPTIYIRIRFRLSIGVPYDSREKSPSKYQPRDLQIPTNNNNIYNRRPTICVKRHLHKRDLQSISENTYQIHQTSLTVYIKSQICAFNRCSVRITSQRTYSICQKRPTKCVKRDLQNVSKETHTIFPKRSTLNIKREAHYVWSDVMFQFVFSINHTLARGSVNEVDVSHVLLIQVSRYFCQWSGL